MLWVPWSWEQEKHPSREGGSAFSPGRLRCGCRSSPQAICPTKQLACTQDGDDAEQGQARVAAEAERALELQTVQALLLEALSQLPCACVLLSADGSQLLLDGQLGVDAQAPLLRSPSPLSNHWLLGLLLVAQKTPDDAQDVLGDILQVKW